MKVRKKTTKGILNAAQAHIDALKTKGYIARAGGTRGYWKILK